MLLKYIVYFIIVIISCQTASSVVTKKPSSGKATLVPGQDLLLECEKTDDKKANFKWYVFTVVALIQ